MGLSGLIVYGTAHLIAFPFLIVAWIVLRITCYSPFTGFRRGPCGRIAHTVGGSASPGFEPVIEVIERACAIGHTLGLQYYASVGGVEVVNLFGRVDRHPGARLSDGSTYDREALQMIWSLTKILTSDPRIGFEKYHHGAGVPWFHPADEESNSC